MTRHHHERSACVDALLKRGLTLMPPPTGVRYSSIEQVYLRETAIGQPYDNWRQRRAASTRAVAERRAGAVATD